MSGISDWVRGGGGSETNTKDSLQVQINKMESLKEGKPDAYEAAGGDARLQELKDQLAEQQESQA
jgi:hypothetical protein